MGFKKELSFQLYYKTQTIRYTLKKKFSQYKMTRIEKKRLISQLYYRNVEKE